MVTKKDKKILSPSDGIRKTENNIKFSSLVGKFIEKCAKYMDAKGFLPRNPNRKTTGDRKFLQAEKQLWGHLGLMEENKKTNLLSFNNVKIEKLVDEFYKHYGTVYKL